MIKDGPIRTLDISEELKEPKSLISHDAKNREELLANAEDEIRFHWKGNRGYCGQIINACANSSPSAKRDLEITQSAFVSDVYLMISQQKAQSRNQKSIKEDNSEISRKLNGISERPEREKVLERADMADFSYVDMKKNGDSGKYEVSSIDKLDKYSYASIIETQKTINSPETITKITQILNGERKEGGDLNAIERNFLYLARLNLSKSSVVAENRIGQSSYSDANITFQQSFSINSVKSFANEIYRDFTKLLNFIAEAPGDMVYSLTWLTANVGGAGMKFISNIFKNSKEEKIKQKENLEKEKQINVLSQYNDAETGFSATLFQNKNDGQITLGIRGSDDLSDWFRSNLRFSDSKITRFFSNGKGMPKQIQSLVDFIDNSNEIKEIRKSGLKINLAGHSLGGGLVQMMALMYPGLINEASTFNAPGIKQLDASMNSEDAKALKKGGKSNLVDAVNMRLVDYKANLNLAKKDNSLFGHVVNFRNNDWIGNLGDKDDETGNAHIGYITEKLPGYSHKILDLKKPLEGMTTEGFNDFLKGNRLYNKNNKN